MPTWLRGILDNPTVLMILLAYLFHSGAIPTGTDGLGEKVAAGFAIMAASTPAGEKNKAK